MDMDKLKEAKANMINDVGEFQTKTIERCNMVISQELRTSILSKVIQKIDDFY